MRRRLKARCAVTAAEPVTKLVTVRRATTDNGAARNIMLLPAAPSAKRRIPIIVITAVIMMPAMAVRNGGQIVPPNAKRRIMITAATEQRLSPAALPMRLVRLSLIARLKSAAGLAIRVIPGRETLVLSRQASVHLYLVTDRHQAV